MIEVNIRTKLSGCIRKHREDNKLTYEGMIELTGLNRTQLTRIIKSKGEGVSIDLMETLCDNLGYCVTLEIK